MKRFLIGLSILILLLLLGLAVSWGIGRIHTPINQALQQAQGAARRGDWVQAHAFADDAQTLWKKQHHLTAAFTDHEPMDEIEGLFAQLKIYANARDKEHFCALCAQITQLLQAMTESHQPTWWNFL